MSIKAEVLAKSGLHAYIVEGEKTEALTWARTFAEAFFCEETDAPCGVCPTCLAFKNKEKGASFPDYIEVYPTKKTSKASIKKESIAGVLEEAAMTSYYGAGKLFVFVDFDLATTEGQNALLKLLEEPPEKTAFLLLTERIEQILPTIVSRAGHIQLKAGKKQLDELRHKSFHMLQKVIFSPEEVFLSRQFFEEEKDRLGEVLAYLVSYTRDMAVFYETRDEGRIENKDYSIKIQEAALYLEERIFVAYDGIISAIEYIEKNMNQGLVIEWMLLKFGG